MGKMEREIRTINDINMGKYKVYVRKEGKIRGVTKCISVKTIEHVERQTLDQLI
jgi:hypothetical protein